MAYLLFGLGFIVLAGNFLDFVIGRAGKRRSRQALAEFYFDINEGSWERIFQVGGKNLSLFSDNLLGRPLTLKFFLRVFFVSASMTPLALTVAIYTSGGGFSSSDLSVETFRTIAVFIIINFFFDVISWATASWVFKKMSNGSKSQALMLALLVSFQLILTMTLSYVVSFLSWAYVESLISGYEDDGSSLTWKSLWYLVGTYPRHFGAPDPEDFGMALARAMYFSSFSTGIPHAIFLAIIAGCLVIASSQKILQRPLSILLERAEESSKSVFTLAAVGIAGIVTALAAVQKLLES